MSDFAVKGIKCRIMKCQGINCLVYGHVSRGILSGDFKTRMENTKGKIVGNRA